MRGVPGGTRVKAHGTRTNEIASAPWLMQLVRSATFGPHVLRHRCRPSTLPSGPTRNPTESGVLLFTSRTALASAVALSLIAIAPAAPAAAAAPTAPYDALTLSGFFEDVATPENTSQLSFQQDGERFTFLADFPDAGHDYNVTISALTGQTLVVGTMPTHGVPNSTRGELHVGGNNFACDHADGSVTIHAIERDGANAITSLAASFQHFSCTSGRPVKGELRWKSNVEYVSGQATSRNLRFENRNAGEISSPMTVTLKSKGSSSLVLGAATITGANPEAFLIDADGCTGDTLVYDQTCTVSVVTRPTAIGSQTAKLEIPSNAVGGKEVIDLSVTGYKSNRGTFLPVSPTRILDTRFGTGAPKAPVGPDASIDVAVSTFNGVPASGVSAVVLNVTVTDPTTSGHITVWPTGVARPTASALNFVAGWTGANSVTVAVGANGKVSLYNSAGKTHLVVDVVGYYNDSKIGTFPGGLMHPNEPYRRLDTRTWPYGKLESGDSAILLTNFGAGNSRIKAWAVNITATESEGYGYVTAFAGGNTPPTASTLNLTPGKTVPNYAIVPSRQCWECEGTTYGWQTIEIFTSNTTHVIVDMFAIYDDGYYTGGLRLEPNTPTRIVDSRFGQGTPGALGPAKTASITTPEALRGETTEGLALNVTAVQPSGDTFMTVWPNGSSQPVVSNLNPHAGQIIPNAVTTGLNLDNYQFNVYNNVGTTHFVIDVVGTFYWYPYGASSVTQSGVGAATVRPTLNIKPSGVETTLRKAN